MAHFWQLIVFPPPFDILVTQSSLDLWWVLLATLHSSLTKFH